MAAKPTTKVITNFTGRLTRALNGDLNSGFAKFSSSFGYDPFSKPGNLTWLYQPDNIASSTITDAVLAGKVWSFDSTTRYVYAIGNAARLYRIDPTNSGSTIAPLYDTPSLLTTLAASSPTFNYGGDLDFYNGKVFISSDSLLTRVNFDGTAETVVTGGSLMTSVYHPLKQFGGKLYVGNGANIAEVDSTNLFTSVAKLSPGLPNGMFIRDLDVSIDGNYLIITASYLYPERIDQGSGGDRGNPYAVESYQFLWNGTDLGVTAAKTLPAYPASATNVFLDKNYFFNNDAFGAALFNGNQKLLTFPQTTAPMPAGSSPNGTFLTFIAPEVTGSTINSSTGAATSTFASLYYYGYLDAENQNGLWRMFRVGPTAGKKVWRTPINMMVNNYEFSTTTVLGWGKHYISVFETGAANAYKFYRFVLPPAANTAPILGVYETQTELFSKKIGIAQIRVYTEPTAANNGFQIDLIGSDGLIIDNGTFNYTYAAGSDLTALQGPLERINFNPGTKTTYALGIRITNTGTSNMTIKKVELDISEEGQ